MLVKLAETHDSGVVERKEKEEKVLGASTWKKAGALAREEGAGGFSVLSDNAGKVYKYILYYCPPYFCNRVHNGCLLNYGISLNRLGSSCSASL